MSRSRTRKTTRDHTCMHKNLSTIFFFSFLFFDNIFLTSRYLVFPLLLSACVFAVCADCYVQRVSLVFWLI